MTAGEGSPAGLPSVGGLENRAGAGGATGSGPGGAAGNVNDGAQGGAGTTSAGGRGNTSGTGGLGRGGEAGGGDVCVHDGGRPSEIDFDDATIDASARGQYGAWCTDYASKNDACPHDGLAVVSAHGEDDTGSLAFHVESQATSNGETKVILHLDSVAAGDWTNWCGGSSLHIWLSIDDPARQMSEVEVEVDSQNDGDYSRWRCHPNGPYNGYSDSAGCPPASDFYSGGAELELPLAAPDADSAPINLAAVRNVYFFFYFDSRDLSSSNPSTAPFDIYFDSISIGP